MKIVIDIDENLYTRLFDNGETNAVDMLRVCVAIRKGVLLPKGHGDLIDKSEAIISLFDYYNGKKTVGQCIDEVQTIIESNKEVHDADSN